MGCTNGTDAAAVSPVMMRSRLLAYFLLLAATSAVATEIPFSEPRRTGAAAYWQSSPAIASNGIDYLVTWTTSASYIPNGMHVYAAQVRADGTVVGDYARQLDAEQDRPAQRAYGVSLSAGRDGYFAAWMSEKGVTAAALDSYGRVEVRTTLPQDDPSGSGRTLTAWDGSTHIVLAGAGSLYNATLFDDNAQVIASNITLSRPNRDSGLQAVVADSAGFLVLFKDRGFASGQYADTIYGMRISTTGAAGDWFLVRAVASAVGGISAMSDGSRDIIAWSDQFGLWTMPFDPQTNTAGASRQVSGIGGATLTRVTRAPGAIWIAYSTAADYDDFALPLASDGSPGTAVALGKGNGPDIASNGATLLSARSLAVLDGDIEGRFVGATADFPISRSQTDQQNGELASDGQTVLATWDERIGEDRQIFAARFAAAGRPLDGAGIQISSGSGTNARPSAAWNGTAWLIVWTRATRDGVVAVARRLTASGAVIDTEDIVLGAASTTAPRVASDGSSWLVAWTGSRNVIACGHDSYRPIVARVSAGGSVLDPGGIDVAPQLAASTDSIDVAWNGSRYVAAWSTSCWYGGHSIGSYSAAGAMISPDLRVIDQFALGGPLTTARVSVIRVSGDADGAVIAWSRGSGVEYQLVTTAAAPRQIRSRVVATSPVVHLLGGWLVGVSRSATGEFMIFTRKKIPWAAAYDGVFFSILGSDGFEIGSGLSAILTDNEQFTGHVVRQGPYAWVTDGRFDPAGGAQRQWLSIIDRPH